MTNWSKCYRNLVKIDYIQQEAKKCIQKQKDIQNFKDMCGVQVKLDKYIASVDFRKSASSCLSITQTALETSRPSNRLFVA